MLSSCFIFSKSLFLWKELFGDELVAGSVNVILCFLAFFLCLSFNLCCSYFSSEFFKSSCCLFFRSLSFLKYSSWFFDFKQWWYSFCRLACVFLISYKKKQNTNLRKVQSKYFNKSWNVCNSFHHFGLLFGIWFPLFVFGINMKRPALSHLLVWTWRKLTYFNALD